MPVFLRSPPQLPWTIPGWGQVRQDFSGYVLHEGRAVPALVAGVIGASLTVALALLVTGFSPSPATTLWSTVAAAVVGAAAAVVAGRRTAAPVLCIDGAGRQVVLRDGPIPFSTVDRWVVRWTESSTSSQGRRISRHTAALALRRTDGTETALRQFGEDPAALQAARKIAATFAGWTGRPWADETGAAAPLA